MGTKVVDTDTGLDLVGDGEPCEHQWQRASYNVKQNLGTDVVTQDWVFGWFCPGCLTFRTLDPQRDIWEEY